MGTPQRWGTDIYVSGLGDNDEPQITALADGRFVVAWIDNYAQEIRAQILNADGSPHGSRFTIGGTAYGEQMHPNIASLADGRFVAVWTDQSDPKYDDNTGSAPGHRADVFGQVFNIDGTASSEAFKVNVNVPPTHAFHQPGVTALEDGGFAITWRDYMASEAPGVNVAGVRFVRYDSQGSQVVEPKLIDSSSNYSDVQPVVQALDNGNLVVVWSQGTITNEINLLARIVDADGNKIEELGDIGAPYTDVANVVQITPDITKLADGGFVVTWKIQDESTGAHDFAVWARVFEEDGSARTEAFNISPPENVLVDPVVTALRDGRFMVTWANFVLEETNDSEIKSQVFTADGIKDGGTFTVHAPDAWAHDQMPRVSTLVDGRVVVSWWHDGGPTIRAQILDPREAAILLTGTTFNDDWVGTGLGDTFDGGAGNDQIEAGAGADAISGGEGFDTVTFAHAGAGVAASMTGGWAGDAAGDTYTSVEQMIGSKYSDHLLGGAGADVLRGGAGDDILDGGAGGDLLDGGEGFDFVSFASSTSGVTAGPGNSAGDTWISIEGLIGSAHADTLTGTGASVLAGSDGNDTYYVSGSDRVIEVAGGGYDTVIFTGTYQLNAGAEVEELRLAGASSKGSYSISGSNGANTLKGSVGKDTLKGLDGQDKLYGASGDDKLYGGYGNDLLLGDRGKDSFVFDSKLGTSTTDRKVNFDTISDFSMKDDTIQLENKIFTKLKKTGTLKKDFFVTGTEANDKDDYIVYNKKAGVLSYDADGSGKGKAIEFAQVKKGLALSHLDILVI
ncbi:calcium-binding protein [Microvirga sp. BT689]|uniref:calcium-binding protein n=1 Tax=Microvirga arvi TaxID=2778731 RepID=UPI0019519443|nr:calcium-binding protein [Microvirga arvi]MBM6584058.1 calcium-binding protein [Microvirga arvi]